MNTTSDEEMEQEGFNWSPTTNPSNTCSRYWCTLPQPPAPAHPSTQLRRCRRNFNIEANSSLPHLHESHQVYPGLFEMYLARAPPTIFGRSHRGGHYKGRDGVRDGRIKTAMTPPRLQLVSSIRHTRDISQPVPMFLSDKPWR